MATCPTCGYSLHGLTEWRCPECGSPFTSETLKQPRGALPWDRTDKSFFSRFFSTLLLSWFKPHRYFAAAAQNPAKPIRTPGRFILACIVLGAGLQMGYWMAATIIRFIIPMRGSISLRSPTQLLLVLIPLDTAHFTLEIFLHIIICAVILWYLSKRQSIPAIGQLTALLMPALPLESVMKLFGALLPLLINNAGDVFGRNFAPFCIRWIFLVVSMWFCGRKLLQLSRLRTGCILGLACLVSAVGSEIYALGFYGIVWKASLYAMSKL